MKYEWAVVGGGIAGISIAEILTRQGHSCVLIEKNPKLGSETTAEFHEWLHTGALYTLIPDGLKTLKYVIGAIDDLLEFYGSYKGMNIRQTESGLNLIDVENNWFQKNYINFKFRIKGRKLALPWIFGIARAIHLIEKIHHHDWLRRRAGEIAPFKLNSINRIRSIMIELLKHPHKFYEIETSDFTMASRNLLKDLLATSIGNGLKVSCSNEIKIINYKENANELIGTNATYEAKNIALCNSHGINNFHEIKINKSFAPIGVVTGLSEKAKSFVELDYFPKKCINLITKGNGVGQIGGISFRDINKCDQYLDYVLQQHMKYEKNIKEIHRYNGVKSEITFKNNSRDYLYHIVDLMKNTWAIIPGKFTLAFSMAPEFYRTVYKKNPNKHFQTTSSKSDQNYYLAETIWRDKVNKH